jgi:transposase
MLALEPSSPPSRKRKYSTHSDDVRASVVRARESGLSWPRVAELSGVPRSTARHIVQQAHTEGRTHKRHKGGAHHTVYSSAERATAVSAQESDAVLRLCDLQQRVEEAHAHTPALSTIHRWLVKAGYTTKNTQQYANERNTDSTKAKRAAWCRDVGPLLRADTAVFIDETPFSFTLMRTRGRSRRGQPALGVVPAIRGKNHTVIAAISPTRGLIHYEIKCPEPDFTFASKRKGAKKLKTAPKGVTRDRFREFLIHLFPKLGNTHHTLVFDNARIHTGDIDETIFQAGHDQQRLPPWSCELNPIEYMFAEWKLAYRVLYPVSEQEVDEAIHQSAKSITPPQCNKSFEHTQSLYAQCIAREDL